GLQINPTKSASINIEKGKMIPGSISLHQSNDLITCINNNETIKYLGINFNSEIIFDDNTVKKISDAANNLITTPLLHKDQKLNILNQYLLPILTYPLQSAPRNKIPLAALDSIDTTIRTTIKAIVGLPTSTANGMIYA